MRVRPEALAAVERLANAELRSVNAEVEVLLREALGRRGVPLNSSGNGEEPRMSQKLYRSRAEWGA
ncbi:hypothetical protein EIK80_18985 [Caulobacter sp. 602-1]|nr:hypothetical protein EIK80_18985 [Caulobacter sp. 602-1]